MIVYMAIAFVLVGIVVPFVGTEGSFLTCVVLAAICLVAAGRFNKARNSLYLLSALCIVVLPNTTFVPQVNSFVGSAVLIALGAYLLLNQIRQSKLTKSL